MWAMIIFMAAGFAIGYLIDFPLLALGSKYLGLLFLALLDGVTFALARDYTEPTSSPHPVIARLLAALAFGGLVIYFGDRSQTDLYLVALVPLGIGVAFNLYKFLPK